MKKYIKFFKQNRNEVALFLLGIIFVLILREWVYEKKVVLENQKKLHVSKIQKEIKYKVFHENIEKYIQAGSNLVKNEEIIKNIGKENRKVKHILKGAMSALSLSNIYIMDKQGNVIHTVVESFRDKNYGFRPYFQNAIKGELDIYPAVGVTTNVRGIYMSLPIYNKKNIIQNVLVMKINVKNLENDLSEYTEKIYLVSPEGVVFISNEKNALYKVVYEIEKSKINQILTSKQYGNKNLDLYEANFKNKELNIKNKSYIVFKDKLKAEWSLYILMDKDIKVSIGPPEREYLIRNLISKLLIYGIIVFLYFLIDYMLKEQQKRKELSIVIEEMPVSTVITDIEGKIIYVNDKFCEVSGYTKEEAIGENPRIMQSGIHSKEFYQEMWWKISAGIEWHGEFCNKRKNGSQYWEEATIIPMKDESGKVYRYFALKEDVTEKHKYIEKLQYYAEIDELTGIYNRRTGMLMLENMIEFVKKDKDTKMTIIYIDLDNLKWTNDNLGHSIGDDMLYNFVKMVNATLREGDIFCRLGGDEFLIILAECSEEFAMIIWKRIEQQIDEANKNWNKDYILSASKGISEYDKKRKLNIDEYIVEADKKMYKEKISKKN